MLNPVDGFHAWATSVLAGLATPLLTCDAVLAETAFHLRSSARAVSVVERGLVKLALVCSDHVTPLALLAAAYEDRHPDFADLCLIRMSELFPRHVVVTTDSDFRVYRRNGCEAIPVILPP